MDLLFPVVDAAGGDPGHPERPGLAGRDAGIPQTPPADAQQAAGNRFRQVAIGLDDQAAAGPAGRSWF